MEIIFVLSFFVLIGGITGVEINDDEYYQLPKLFHLDEYEECLVRGDGLYCLGTFHVTPPALPNTLYDLLLNYTEEIHTFNRTQIHRGYCVSSRCPLQNGTHRERFEKCVSELMEPYSLDVELMTLDYCHQRADQQRMPTPDAAQLVYLIAICALVVMNVIGTVYEIRTKDNPKKIQALMAWSVIANWKLLTSSENAATKTPLTALHGIRVCIAIGTCLSHAAFIFYTVYISNPRVLENYSSHPLSMLLQNSTAMEQMFVVMSGFLFAFHLRKYSLKQTISYKAIPLIIVKRIFRVLPVSLLVVGFAATWWPVTGGGPIWRATVGAQSDVCREKFWSHMFFVHNLVQSEKICVLPTWYIAVDVQMHIMATFLMVFLIQCSSGILLVLGVLFLLSCLLNAVLAYIFDWIPMLYLTVSPENLRTIFMNEPSFAGLYISPWGSMPACFLGLFLGYFYFGMKDGEYSLGKYKWLLNMSCIISFVLMFSWVLLGYFVQHIKIKMFMVFYAAMERSIFQLILLVSYIIVSVVCGFLIKFMAWRGWHAMSRLSLPVMMVHWLVNMYLVGSTSQPIAASIINISIYGITTAVYTYLLAIPITILVEMPMKKSFDLITP